jgi:hypothetical protein
MALGLLFSFLFLGSTVSLPTDATTDAVALSICTPANMSVRKEW